MHKLKSLRSKGQAAALDLAIFVSICILALSYLFIQSTKASGSTMFVQENENINEVAIRVVDALAKSSAGGINITTLQRVSLTEVESCLSEDIRTILGYIDKALSELDDLEKQAKRGDMASSVTDNPFIVYVDSRMQDLSEYLMDSTSLLDGVQETFDNSIPGQQDICDAISSLSGLFPGYSDLEVDCGISITSDFLSELETGLTNASGLVENYWASFKQGLVDTEDALESELSEAIRGIRCVLEDAKGAANSMLSYLEAGIDPGISFMELLPVEASLKKATIEKLASDALKAKGNFAYGDEMRALAGGAGLLYSRGKDLGEHLPDFEFSNSSEDGNYTEVREAILMIPRSPLEAITNASAKGPYYELTFMPESYITPAKALALRLTLYGGPAEAPKHLTKYFEDFSYVWNSSAYPSSQHTRTYNSSFIFGFVTESAITKSEQSWTEARNTGPELNETILVTEERILRPMTAKVSYIYENLTWPNATYSFDLNHTRTTRESNYTIGSNRNCSQYNESDAEKSMILGFLASSRGSLFEELKKAIESRLDELLEGYNYSFELRDCCNAVFAINDGDEPAGRSAVAKYYLNGDGSLAEMRLTVWRG